jgi:hypothetical protein
LPFSHRKQQPEPYGQTAVIIFLLLLFLLAVLCIGIGLSWLDSPPPVSCPSASAAVGIARQKKIRQLVIPSVPPYHGKRKQVRLCFVSAA